MKPKPAISLLPLVLCILISAFLGWVDSRPHWNDTGITVCAVFLSAFLFGVFGQGRPWLYALILGSGVFLFNAILHHVYSPAVAFAFSFAGAYTGFFIKWFFRKVVKE